MYFKSLSLNLLLQLLVLKTPPLKKDGILALAGVANTLRVYSLFRLMVESD